MADIKTKYPASSTVAITFAIATLASDAALLVGRASTAIDNTTNLDLDHLVSGLITTGTTPIVNTIIEIWVYVYRSIASGVPTYPDSITGTDANKTLTSANVKYSALRHLHSITVDAVTARGYEFAPVSIAGLFGGSMPPFWGLFVVQNTGVALNASSGNHIFHYERVQAQTV